VDPSGLCEVIVDLGAPLLGEWPGPRRKGKLKSIDSGNGYLHHTSCTLDSIFVVRNLE
jgi:hypothetical protein